MDSTEIIEKIRAEIERQEKQCSLDTYEGRHKLFILGGLKTRLSDLEKEEKPSEGLEEEIDKVYLPNRVVGYVQGVGKILLGREAFAKIARHFYEFGRQSKPKVCEGLEEEAESCWRIVFPDGGIETTKMALTHDEFIMCARHFAQWGAEHAREQMMNT